MRASIAWWSGLIGLLIVQTTFLPHLTDDAWRPDFTRALVVWVALTGQPRGGVYCAFGAGLAVDAFSGAPLGVTALTRLLLYAVTRPMRGVVELSWQLAALGPLAVALDTLIVAAVRSFAFANAVGVSALLGVALRQSLVELIAFPALFLAMELATGYRSREEAAA